jgi:uncharacterized protein
MILDVSNLIKKKIQVLPFDLTYDEETLEREGFSINLNSPLRVVGNAYYDGEMIRVKGEVSVLIQAQCSRCLENVNYPLELDFEEEFSKLEIEDSYPILEGDDIDLKDMVIDNIILSMPLRLLCSDECKGLCPNCGKDLNKGSCGCDIEDLDPRLSALKDLFKGN